MDSYEPIYLLNGEKAGMTQNLGETENQKSYY
jgi:hypothetical protein